jgi:hypothetical protein
MNHKMFSTLVVVAISSRIALSSGKDEQQIRVLYGKLERAFLQKDVSLLKAIEAPGFTETENGKTYTAEQANAMMRQDFAMTKSIATFKIKIISLKVNGNSAHAVTSYWSDSTVGGMSKNDKKTHKMHVSGRNEEELVKTSKGWLFKYSVGKESKATLDGKPFNAMG